MNRLLISGTALFVLYIIRFIIGFASLNTDILAVVLGLAKWGLLIWFIIEIIIYFRKNKKAKTSIAIKNREAYNKRWLISLIVTVVGGFFAFGVAMGDKPGMTESQILTISLVTVFIISVLAAWLLTESVIFIRRNKDALPLCLMTILFSTVILLVMLISMISLAIGPNFAFLQWGKMAFFIIFGLIFSGLAIWTVVKGIILMKNKTSVHVGVTSLVVGGMVLLASFWIIFGTIYYSFNPPSVATPVAGSR